MAKWKETRLERAARLIRQEIEDLINSAPRGTLNRLRQIEQELEDIEAHL